MTSDMVGLYGDQYVKRFEANQRIERLRRLVPLMDLCPSGTVADIACGSGLLVGLIAPLVKEYIGVDFSPHFIDAANRRRERLGIENASFCCTSIEDFCGRYPETFDACLAMDVSEHIPDDEWISILTAIRASMKNGGKLYVHTPNANFLLEIMKSKNLLISQLNEHVAVRTPSLNAEMLNRAGFSRIETILLPHYNFLKLLHPISFLPGVGKYFKARIFIIAQK